ncbi:glycosyltransferase family 2 protein [Candidatus Kaiserbacteria bacterium]|nr:glycosyltransferase family 2 protein [Candidatus Kaiserbacteria bacterium]
MISCVICAYNEASRIGNVLRVVVGHPSLDEVVVVDDGSQDGTRDVVRGFPQARLVALERNVGKSKAFIHGVLQAKGDFIMLLDADLENLSSSDVAALSEPVLSGKADWSISLRRNAPYTFRIIGIDFLSGERLVPRRLITDYQKEIAALPSYGLETFMNKYLINRGLRLAIVPFDTVRNTRKREKVGWWNGTVADWKMAIQIVKITSFFGVIRQIYAMLKLSQR